MKLTAKRALVGTALAGTLAGGGVAVQRGCGESECAKLAGAVEAVCAAAPVSRACTEARGQYEARCQTHEPACPLPGQSADPATWCGCWETSGRTGGEWHYIADCPLTCADLACPHGCVEPPATCLPAPGPDPSPVCAPGDTCGCWHRPPGEAWQQLPPCPPDPPPPGPEPTTCTIPLNGAPVLGAYWHMDRVVDFTPKISNAARCSLPEVGYPGRQTCPVCDEGCAQRGVCERDLMGGPRPVWRCESATLKCHDEDGWKVRVAGVGVGTLHASYPNGRASVTLVLNCTAKGCRP